MNALTNNAEFSEVASENQLAVMANIGDLVKGRDTSIDHWLDAYDGLHRTIALASAASVGGKLCLSMPPRHSNDTSSELTAAMLNTQEVRRNDKETWKTTVVSGRDDYQRIITQSVDRRCWDDLMQRVGFDQLLDRQAREEFRTSMRTDPPAFTEANCAATFGHLWGNRREMYLRGIANVFMKMDRRFRSHDAFAIGSRLIIERAFGVDSWSTWQNYDRRDTLHDVERIFRELDEQPLIGVDNATGIVQQVADAKRGGHLPQLVQGDYFRVRVFQNGNLHLWFERKDLLKQVNDLLLEYYKPVEGDVGEGPSYEAGPLYHPTPAKNYGAFFTSEAVAEIVIKQACIMQGDSVLEPSAGSGVLARAARKAGGNVTCIEIQPGLAHELGAVHRFQSIREGNFLRFEVADVGTFDKIVMNPPFDRGRDCDHVRHAWQFLKPGGTLVAIMSARAEFGTDARHKALHDLFKSGGTSWNRPRWIDLPEKSFAHAGTNVNTVMLVMEKARER